jgi:hypothetical protein
MVFYQKYWEIHYSPVVKLICRIKNFIDRYGYMGVFASWLVCQFNTNKNYIASLY